MPGPNTEESELRNDRQGHLLPVATFTAARLVLAGSLFLAACQASDSAPEQPPVVVSTTSPAEEQGSPVHTDDTFAVSQSIPVSRPQQSPAPASRRETRPPLSRVYREIEVDGLRWKLVGFQSAGGECIDIEAHDVAGGRLAALGSCGAIHNSSQELTAVAGSIRVGDAAYWAAAGDVRLEIEEIHLVLINGTELTDRPVGGHWLVIMSPDQAPDGDWPFSEVEALDVNGNFLGAEPVTP